MSILYLSVIGCFLIMWPSHSSLPDVSSVCDGASWQPGGSQRPDSAWRPAGGSGGPSGQRSAAPRPRPDPEESREHAETEHHTATPYAHTHTHTHAHTHTQIWYWPQHTASEHQQMLSTVTMWRRVAVSQNIHIAVKTNQISNTSLSQFSVWWIWIVNLCQ